MKRIICLVMLCLMLPGFSVNAEELRFSGGGSVYSVRASYEILTENAVSVEVQFNSDISDYAYSNFKDGVLWISVASVEKIDLSKPLGTVTAVLEDNSGVTAELALKTLRINGKDVYENLIPKEVHAKADGENLAVNIAVRDDFLSTHPIAAAAYSADNRLMGIKMQTFTPDEREYSFVLSIPNCADAKWVKVFFMDSDIKPKTGFLECETE